MPTTISYSHDGLTGFGVDRWSGRNLNSLLHDRELRNYGTRSRKIRASYGRPEWVDNLDIVNELNGHSGCVNALSWSKSGRLLASGSDDKHLNIHEYQPDNTNAQFTLATTVATGHTANIFSVKFMPHSNDKTVITCAGDGQIRVFDLEASATSSSPVTTTAPGSNNRRRGRGAYTDDVRYLTDDNTNCRTYSSHGDRVKRIVTESSPFLFLSCSEDGEVRQWDLRLPSAAYPRPQRRDDSAVPPPLISYKPFFIDLHTISCSASQPYYIALGGSHLHCFLHDRRMLGRDRLSEAGQNVHGLPTASDGDTMGNATRCVRKFAPGGQQRMRRSDNGHITACKISDAHPNELIVSWSGEHIYSFDLIRSPPTSDALWPQSPTSDNAAQLARDLKRKRVASRKNSDSHQGNQHTGSRPRTVSPGSESQSVALRVQFGNGQSEDIPVREPCEASTIQTPTERTADDLARRTVKLASVLLDRRPARPSSVRDPTGWSTSYTSVLGFSAATLPEMRHINSTWRYPVDTTQTLVASQRRLRADRESAIRYVQAAGVVARTLGGKLQSAASSNAAFIMFEQIHVSDADGPDLSSSEQFKYDFLKAIFLWLDSGVGAMLHHFSKDVAPSGRASGRFPVPSEADMDSIDSHLIPYLLNLASDDSIVNLDVSRFEVDENRLVFRTEKDAVREFAEAVRKPFADLSADFTGYDESTQQRSMAVRFWGMTVARGILGGAWDRLGFAVISRAFGGIGEADSAMARQENDIRERIGSISGSNDDDDDERNLASASIQLSHGNESIAVSDLMETIDGTTSNGNDEDEENEDEDDDYDDDDEDHEVANEDSDDADDSDDDSQYDFGFPGRLQRSTNRRKAWANVEASVPCVPHTRSYHGHCNVKTVKDVNFYGLDDEYVVSGSDSGHVFIWDRKTCKLLNILEGDGEVVNVIQGHPYEPMLAVSGIDSTIKIFSPDARARYAARMGHDVEAADASTFSSISWPSRVTGRRVARPATTASTSQSAMQDADQARPTIPPEDDDDYVAPSGLSSRRQLEQAYQIMNENDRTRQGGNQEAYLTRSMLEQLARSIRMRREAEGRGQPEEDADRPRIILTDDCAVQ